MKTVARNEARQALVEKALEHLARSGPANVHPKEICEELGLSKALVNYHFGGRDGLITEAMVVGYERYVAELWDAAERAGTDSVERLFAWVERQIDWTAKHPGLAAALNFPETASGMPLEHAEGAMVRLSEAGERNFANLQQLTAGAIRATRRIPASRKLPQGEAGLQSALIGWLTLGLSVWNAGRHLPTQRLAARKFLGLAKKHMREQILVLLKG